MTLKDSLEAADSPPDPAVVGDKKIKVLAVASPHLANKNFQKDLPPSCFGLGTKFVAKISKNKVAVERYINRSNNRIAKICSDKMKQGG